MEWQDTYKKRLVSAEEAVKVVKSGDLVFISPVPDPVVLCEALVARRAPHHQKETPRRVQKDQVVI